MKYSVGIRYATALHDCTSAIHCIGNKISTASYSCFVLEEERRVSENRKILLFLFTHNIGKRKGWGGRRRRGEMYL